jgi:hypothetical protein
MRIIRGFAENYSPLTAECNKFRYYKEMHALVKYYTTVQFIITISVR